MEGDHFTSHAGSHNLVTAGEIDRGAVRRTSDNDGDCDAFGDAICRETMPSSLASLATSKATVVVFLALELVLEKVCPSLEASPPSETKVVGELQYFAQGDMRHVRDTVAEET